MAVSTTTIRTDSIAFIFDVIASADTDTVTALTAHGLGVVPQQVSLTSLLQASAALSEWAVTTLDATNISLQNLPQ